VRAHEGALQLGEARGVDARASERAEARVDAVRDATLVEHPPDRRGGGVDAGQGARIERQGAGRGP
jgi:hypothetical protein